MSRIIVKNLPSTITEKKLREIFEEKGFITDLQLKYNKAGVFRKFAFIGYKTEEEAKIAKEYFDNTFIFTSKVEIDICANLNDPNKRKPWNEFLKEKAQSKVISSDVSTGDIKNENKTSKSDNDVPEELKNDPSFKDFLAVHENRASKPLWADDIGDIKDENESSNDDEYDVTNKRESENEKSESEKNLENLNENKEGNCEKNELKQNTKKVKIHNDMFTVKVTNLPYSCKKKQIKELFQSLQIASLRLPPRTKGFAYVSFKTEKDMNIALNKNKGFLGGHRIGVIKYTNKQNFMKQIEDRKLDEDKEKDMESLAETGSIYVRNLCYTVTELEIEELFSKYGPLTEVHLPMDLLVKKAKGFAFVSYVFAEHAVKAFTELDGTIFQGRLLHLIPAKPKKETIINENETNYKKKKEANLKSLSGSSHNWNILFMSMNAVADIISEKYDVAKSKLLSGNSNESLAVRMALAETQVVMETRKFLIDNGVVLDAFSQPAAERSKTVIIVKHLPAKTSSGEIHEVFSKYGTISKIILPPSGLVALVEFQNPTEAKTAFKKLAYTRFRHLPLYLEWAPMDSIKDPPINSSDSAINESTKGDKIEVSPEDKLQKEKSPPPGTTIFVKNLNFCTTQENFRKHFEKCGHVYNATISTKVDIKTGKTLSMGFGFVQYNKKSSALKALQNLQLSNLDGSSLELKFARQTKEPSVVTYRKKANIQEQISSKILVKNIPFEASEKEVSELFKQFGMLKFVRLPKKMGNMDQHRGFGFVEYITKSDAKMAFETLCHSTHLYGRRLVLEWADTESEDVEELRRKTAREFSDGTPRKKLKKSKLKEDVALSWVRSTPEEK